MLTMIFSVKRGIMGDFSFLNFLIFLQWLCTFFFFNKNELMGFLKLEIFFIGFGADSASINFKMSKYYNSKVFTSHSVSVGWLWELCSRLQVKFRSCLLQGAQQKD